MNKFTIDRLMVLSGAGALRALKKIAGAVKGRALPLAGIVAAVSAVALGAAVLTPGTGILSATIFARAGFADPTDIKIKVKGRGNEIIHVPDARETAMQQIVIAPGGHTG